MEKIKIKIRVWSGPEVVKKFMLNSAEHEIYNAHIYKNIKKKISFFQAQISL